ncbi:MAG: hypothetical protein C0616_06905 [Desulfuromonas sp.]|nr:MAG: hypothetical protein C0616_06905 [Desulfuromonas sp.]
MVYEIRDLNLPVGMGESELHRRVADRLGVEPQRVSGLRIVRRAIDSRQKPRIKWVLTVRFELDPGDGEAELLLERGLLSRVENRPPEAITRLSRPRPVLVVGMGPSGLFAAWQLARHGVPVTLLERGRPVEQRVVDVRRFWDTGVLDPESNVQFGEGGAGTFSDGKLTTRLKHPDIRLILEQLVNCGAPESILVDARPHVGTDRLRLVLLRLRQVLIELGVQLRYESTLTGLCLEGEKVCGGKLRSGESLLADAVLLAPGHSSREVFRMLADTGVMLEAKGFAVGLRVEHPAGLIDAIQYGQRPRHPDLPPADYRLAWNEPGSKRGIYSFCMCPGGEVVNASSESGRLVVNGMSSLARAGEFSNSALVVSVGVDDMAGTDIMAGLRFQEELEARAFQAAGADFMAPAQNMMAFLGRGSAPLQSSVRPGVRDTDLGELLPGFITSALRQALPQFDRRMRGFVTRDACLVGVETRTSSPLRIVRGADGQSISHPGLYPAGEGAGYAGGIMSSALDGLRCANSIIQRQREG